MKFILALALACYFSSGDGVVYICDSSLSVAYHFKRDCRGLNNCKHEVIKTNQADAEKLGLKICGWED
ncbi:hypothetical protein [Fluviicola taffensis]|uniref:Uncharacterized protein n=1 Tax=Fluviicola taffensis (strain DSM 16823 / NCIMB 13979 / RW262) TaxID=755732 RepID=F2IH33_FLUTR|nr:hypothetical protein [Fluviicola taffensis]AEA45847.1 hypothetical protein Fluta_3883 [Fluviicola taffensis DSM 16823]